jgi:hypothetical protein
MIGTTPLEISLKFWQEEDDIWLQGMPGGYETPWPLPLEGQKHKLRYYLKKEAYYPILVNTYLSIIDSNDKSFTAEKALDAFWEGYRTDVFNCPIELIEDSGTFAVRFSAFVEEGDYNYAEKLRLERIRSLKTRIEENQQFLNNLASDYAKTNSEAINDLISAELELLEHTVGLLDKELMKRRKRLVEALDEGRYGPAYIQAKFIESLEKKYFPIYKPVVIELPYLEPDRQKSKYGVKKIIRRLHFLTIKSASPKEYKKSLGDATLMDVMGFTQYLN